MHVHKSRNESKALQCKYLEVHKSERVARVAPGDVLHRCSGGWRERDAEVCNLVRRDFYRPAGPLQRWAQLRQLDLKESGRAAQVTPRDSHIDAQPASGKLTLRLTA